MLPEIEKEVEAASSSVNCSEDDFLLSARSEKNEKFRLSQSLFFLVYLFGIFKILCESRKILDHISFKNFPTSNNDCRNQLSAGNSLREG